MQITVSPDPAADAARWLARRLRVAVRHRGRATVALSGGSTAPSLIAALLDPSAVGALAWDAIGVWQVDERVAPDGDPARNAGQLAGLPCRVYPMPVTAVDVRAAARRYAARLPDRFDVVHLGLGADGHTASWPPGRPDVITSDRAVELVDEFNGFPRMTLTGRVVNGARERFVLAGGADKRPMVERWLLGDRSLPVTAVRRTNTTAFLDHNAAPPSPVVE
ncbi:MAG TPA: 6-phosphogluconolactonase [Ilumatobacter sp.]|nr:6-phosphogluconolactonase [Ilumatobacter sp.]